jgi:hypothetical protein
MLLLSNSTRLYHTLKTGAQLAAWADSTSSLADTWNNRAENLKKAINQYCWDDAYGTLKDNATATTLHPQDVNSMAVLFGIVNQTRAASISERLTDNWTPIGAVAPELPENISPFISSFEIQGHFCRRPAHQSARAHSAKLGVVSQQCQWHREHCH